MSNVIKLASGKFNAFSQYLHRGYSDRPIHVLPDIRSDDPNLLALARSYSDMWADTKMNSKDGFIGEPYLLGNFDALRQIAGFPSNPLGTKPPVGRPHAKSNSELFMRYLVMVTKIMSKHVIPTGITINKKSSIGFPSRSFDIRDKLSSLYYFIKNFDKIATYAEKTVSNEITVDKWMSEFNFVPISLEGRRFQHTDKIIREDNGNLNPKTRKVFDWTGKEVAATRHIKGYDDFFRVRARFVYGAPGHLNYGAQYFASALRNYMGKKFPFMFYTGPHNLGNKVSKFRFAISADVAAFDQSFDQQVSDTIIDNLQCYSESVKSLMRLMVAMPALIKNDYIDGSGYKVSQDLNGPLNTVSSNPSGWAWVTEYAKIVGVTLMLCALDNVMKIDDSNIEDLLLGKLDIAFLNTGDDMVFLFQDDIKFNKFKESLSKGMLFHTFKLEFEEVVSYLGMSLARSSSGVLALNDIRNIVIKTHVPERSFDSIHKRFFAFGFRSKLDIYASHPRFNEVFRKWNELVKKHLGKDILHILELDKLPPSNQVSVNLADRVFLDNPDSIYYKIPPEAVSRDVLHEVFAYVDADTFFSLSKHLIGVID